MPWMSLNRVFRHAMPFPCASPLGPSLPCTSHASGSHARTSTPHRGRVGLEVLGLQGEGSCSAIRSASSPRIDDATRIRRSSPVVELQMSSVWSARMLYGQCGGRRPEAAGSDGSGRANATLLDVTVNGGLCLPTRRRAP